MAASTARQCRTRPSFLMYSRTSVNPSSRVIACSSALPPDSGGSFTIAVKSKGTWPDPAMFLYSWTYPLTDMGYSRLLSLRLAGLAFLLLQLGGLTFLFVQFLEIRLGKFNLLELCLLEVLE